MTPRLVKVVWMDAVAENAIPKYGGTLPLLECYTVGWLIRDDKVLVTVAQEDSGDEWRAVTSIPKSQVVRIVPLRESK